MAKVVVTNGATTLATVNGFYRAEAYNLSTKNSGPSLSSTFTLPVTFANAGNCQGLIICLKNTSNTATSSMKNVKVTLQENVATVWTDRATVTINGTSIYDGANAYGSWITPFTGGTFPYAVSALPLTWRFQISETGSGTDWTLACSDSSTNPFYVTWCDNAVSFATGDVPICKDLLTIDMTAEFTGILSTSETVFATCAVLCKAASPLIANVHMMQWENPPVSAYTLTLNGYVIMSSHSGFRMGTSAARIPVAQKGIIIFNLTSSVGSAGSGFMDCMFQQNNAGSRNSLFFYGAIDSKPYTLSTQNISTGATTVTVADPSVFLINDFFAIGRRTGASYQQTAYSQYKVTNIAGSTLTFTPALGTSNSNTGALVIKTKNQTTGSYYGIELKRSTSALNAKVQFAVYATPMANFTVSGCYCEYLVTQTNGARTIFEESANESAYELSDITVADHTVDIGAVTPSGTAIFNGFCVNSKGIIINRYYGMATTPCSTLNFLQAVSGSSVVNSGEVTLTDVYMCGTTGDFLGCSSAAFPPKVTATRIVIDGYGGLGCFFTGHNSTYNTIEAWGMYWMGWAIDNKGFVNCTVTNYKANNCGAQAGFGQSGIVINNFCTEVFFITPTFGNQIANGFDVSNFNNPYGQVYILTPTGSVSVNTSLQQYATVGSRLSVSNNNSVTNADITYMPEGTITRTGYGLSDTTVRTGGSTFGAASAGKFAMRFAPNNSTNPLKFSQKVPTGDITGRTMSVSVWVKINNAAYYAGVNTLPKLTITYDNGTTTTATATASTSAQLLSVSFAPTTSYGEITIDLTGNTDATSTNAYIYWDDISVLYPAGYSFDLGSLDLWTRALPVSPTIATLPNVGQVWDELVVSHATAGTFGAQATQTAVTTDDNQALILTK